MFSRNSDIHNYNTRGRRNIHLSKISSKSGKRSFSYAAAELFNMLPSFVKNSNSLKHFPSNYWLAKQSMQIFINVYFIDTKFLLLIVVIVSF